MARSKRLQPVAKVSSSREEKAARIFGEAQQKLTTLQDQLQSIHSYRTEYARDFNQRGGAGISGQAVQEYLAFVQGLEGSVSQIEQQIEAAKQDCEEKKKLWFLARNRSKLVDSLIDKYQQDEENSAEKRIQREFDDRAGAKWGASRREE